MNFKSLALKATCIGTLLLPGSKDVGISSGKGVADTSTQDHKFSFTLQDNFEQIQVKTFNKKHFKCTTRSLSMIHLNILSHQMAVEL